MSKQSIVDQDGHQISLSGSISRREFLKRMGILGGGLVIGFSVGDPLVFARMKREGFLGAGIPKDFNAFLRIGTDERVTCLTGKIEMGQGPITSLPQMLADELDVSYDAVDIIMGDTDLCPWDAGTFGSLTTRHFGIFLREAAAEAKGVLLQMAAEQLKVPVEVLKAENGTIIVKGQPEKQITYGRLTKGKIVEKYLTDLPPLKPVSELAVMGKSFFRQDSRDKVTGKAEYAGDIRLPGMLYAKILRPPRHGAKLKHAEPSGAETIKGAQVVREGDFIAVLHEYPDMAEKALARVKAEFDEPRTGIDDVTIFDHLVKNAPAPRISSEAGNLDTGKSQSAITVEETYLDGYVAHAPMEPHTATARMDGKKMTVWVSTQRPYGDQERVSRELSIPKDQVRIITPFVGGGFGGKTVCHQAVEAARLAKMTGRPVQVAWNRAEEFFYDAFRPAGVVKITSGLNSKGQLVYWDYNVFFAGKRGSEPNYTIPHHRVSCYADWRGPGVEAHPFAVGPWRAPANNTNVFAREMHMNLTAEKAKTDPLAFRLAHLKDKRMIGVMEAAAKAFKWTPAPVPSGRGYGIACGIDAGTYVASMAEVKVDNATGVVNVKRVVCAQDMGFVVNPQGSRIQMEGCITMGLGYALSEDIHFKDGKITDTNFDTYPLPRFSWVPKIETVIVDNPDLPPQGGGEPAIIIMGGVIATAIHDATGAKLLQQPMTPERVKKAIESV